MPGSPGARTGNSARTDPGSFTKKKKPKRSYYRAVETMGTSQSVGTGAEEGAELARVLDAFFKAPPEEQRKAAEAGLAEVARLRRQVSDLEREVTKARLTRQDAEHLTTNRNDASLVEAAHEAERRADTAVVLAAVADEKLGMGDGYTNPSVMLQICEGATPASLFERTRLVRKRDEATLTRETPRCFSPDRAAHGADPPPPGPARGADPHAGAVRQDGRQGQVRALDDRRVRG